MHRRLEMTAVHENWRNARQGTWRNKMYKLIRLVDTSFRIAGVANTLVFLWYGVYPTLQRICGVQMVNIMCDGSGVPVTREVLSL